jgi:hypothetical protein
MVISCRLEARFYEKSDRLVKSVRDKPEWPLQVQETLSPGVSGATVLIQLLRTGVLTVGPVLVVSGVEQDFVQASPIKYFPAFCALSEVFFFFGRELFVFVGGHCLTLIRYLMLNDHSIRGNTFSTTFYWLYMFMRT